MIENGIRAGQHGCSNRSYASSMRDDFHMGRLLIAKREAIAAHFEGDRVAQGSPAQNLDRDAVAEAHLKEPAADFLAAADGNDLAVAADAQLVERAGRGRADVRTTSEITGFFHEFSLPAI